MSPVTRLVPLPISASSYSNPSGKSMRIDEVALQEWRGDLIFRERFFYEPPKRD